MAAYYDCPCPKCGVTFGIPVNIDHVFRQSLQTFYCPYGHNMSYSQTGVEREQDRLRQERDRLKQRLAEKDDEIRGWREAEKLAARRVSAAKGQVTRLKNRAAAGVCPCCNRTFENLQRHMNTKHPTFKDQVQDADNVIPLKTA